MKILILSLSLLLAACSSSQTRAQARGAVLVEAEAVKIGDKLCAQTAIEKTDLQLAKACEQAYDVARSSLIIASNGIDAWDESKKSEVVCAISRTADELAKTAKEIRARGVAIPKLIDDALALASSLGGCKS